MGAVSFTILGELYRVLPSNAVSLLATGGLVYLEGVFLCLKDDTL